MPVNPAVSYNASLVTSDYMSGRRQTLHYAIWNEADEERFVILAETPDPSAEYLNASEMLAALVCRSLQPNALRRWLGKDCVLASMVADKYHCTPHARKAQPQSRKVSSRLQVEDGLS